jgi:hypothetical protein|tara:strand:- start:1341 stop:1469 length:129 start_codon:yes stop_codon:yes gene_type:complete
MLKKRFGAESKDNYHSDSSVEIAQPIEKLIKPEKQSDSPLMT